MLVVELEAKIAPILPDGKYSLGWANWFILFMLFILTPIKLLKFRGLFKAFICCCFNNVILLLLFRLLGLSVDVAVL